MLIDLEAQEAMNGKPGDHPLADILVHKRPVFSPAIDDLVRQIADLGGKEELETKFDWFRPPELGVLESELKSILHRLKEEAEDRDWEIDEHLGWTV